MRSVYKHTVRSGSESVRCPVGCSAYRRDGVNTIESAHTRSHVHAYRKRFRSSERYVRACFPASNEARKCNTHSHTHTYMRVCWCVLSWSRAPGFAMRVCVCFGFCARLAWCWRGGGLAMIRDCRVCAQAHRVCMCVYALLPLDHHNTHTHITCDRTDTHRNSMTRFCWSSFELRWRIHSDTYTHTPVTYRKCVAVFVSAI